MSVIDHRSASDKLGVNLLFCIGKLVCGVSFNSPKEICVWQIFSSQRLVNDKLVSIYITLNEGFLVHNFQRLLLYRTSLDTGNAKKCRSMTTQRFHAAPDWGITVWFFWYADCIFQLWPFSIHTLELLGCLLAWEFYVIPGVRWVHEVSNSKHKFHPAK